MMTDTLNLPELPEPDVYRDDHPFGGPPEWFSDDAMRAYATAAVLAERERCAKLCDAIAEQASLGDFADERVAASDCASAIRGSSPASQGEGE